MGVYLEPVRRTDGAGKRSKLRAASAAELHEFAGAMGLDSGLFVPNPTVEDLGYYDLSGRDRRKAVKAGAEVLEWTEAYKRISAQMVAGTRTATARRARFGVTRAISRTTIDLTADELASSATR